MRMSPRCGKVNQSYARGYFSRSFSSWITDAGCHFSRLKCPARCVERAFKRLVRDMGKRFAAAEARLWQVGAWDRHLFMPACSNSAASAAASHISIVPGTTDFSGGGRGDSENSGAGLIVFLQVQEHRKSAQLTCDCPRRLHFHG